MTLWIPRRQSTWQTVVIFGVGTSIGCRVEQCLPHDPSASLIVVQPVVASPLLVVGRVLSVAGGAPVSRAMVRLREAGVSWQSVDSSGDFRIRVPSAGAYTLEISARGFDPVMRVVATRADSGAQVLAIMSPTRPMNRRSSACGIDTVDLSTSVP